MNIVKVSVLLHIYPVLKNNYQMALIINYFSDNKQLKYTYKQDNAIIYNFVPRWAPTFTIYE